VTEIGQIREGKGVAGRAQWEKEAAGGDLLYPGVIAPQEEDSQREDGQ
jgi:hypothetical protein